MACQVGSNTAAATITPSGSSSTDSQMNSDMEFASWPYDKLAQLVDTTIVANEVLKSETEIFARYFSNVKDSFQRQMASSRTAAATDSSLSLGSSDGGSSLQFSRTHSTRHHRSSVRKRFQRLLKLDAGCKCEIVLKEIDRTKVQTKKRSQDFEKVIDHLKVLTEEASAHTTELKKAAHIFERDITKGAFSLRTGEVSSERVIRYFSDSLKARDAYNSKTKLNSQVLRQHYQKLCLVLRQKEELGDMLTEIDYQQLKIENSRCQDEIESRNKDFFRLKTDIATVTHILEHYKKRLHRVMIESKQLNHDVRSRLTMLERLQVETEACQLERSEALTINETLRRNLSQYKVPDVMETVELTADALLLNKKVCTWQRKVSISEMAYNSLRKKLLMMQKLLSDNQWLMTEIKQY